uniref:Uncharacterized protein LOC105123546 n=1 Tax=Rhizophora mucronata TaxID=61149 RepID=A0A2P2L6G7_RHIMU
MLVKPPNGSLYSVFVFFLQRSLLLSYTLMDLVVNHTIFSSTKVLISFGSFLPFFSSIKNPREVLPTTYFYCLSKEQPLSMASLVITSRSSRFSHFSDFSTSKFSISLISTSGSLS